LGVPTSPLGLPSAVWFSLGGLQRALFRQPELRPLVEFRLRLESYPANPSQSAAAVRLLSWTSASLQHIRNRRSTHRRPCRACYGPPSGFGYPLDGFRPSIPRRFCFAPAALMGFTLRSFLLSQGIRAFPPGSTHLPFLPQVSPPPKRRAGPAGRGFWALALARVPGAPARV
jgi:hypothetical protein